MIQDRNLVRDIREALERARHQPYYEARLRYRTLLETAATAIEELEKRAVPEGCGFLLSMLAEVAATVFSQPGHDVSPAAQKTISAVTQLRTWAEELGKTEEGDAYMRVLRVGTLQAIGAHPEAIAAADTAQQEGESDE